MFKQYKGVVARLVLNQRSSSC